jgi:glycerol uptake facilitator-like aquaporin
VRWWRTCFANPAVTVARMFSDTFAGIAPASVPMFVLMQILGATLAGADAHDAISPPVIARPDLGHHSGPH